MSVDLHDADTEVIDLSTDPMPAVDFPAAGVGARRRPFPCRGRRQAAAPDAVAVVLAVAALAVLAAVVWLTPGFLGVWHDMREVGLL